MTESDAETENAQIRLVVQEDKRDKWDRFVEENAEYASRSDLIRSAVTHEIQGSHNAGAGPDTAKLAVQMGEVLDRLEDMKERFGSLDSRLQSLEANTRTDPELTKLTGEAFAVLPTQKQYEDDSLPARIPEEHGGPVANSGKVSDVAALLDVRQLQAQEALDKLHEDTHMVRTDEQGGETRYFKEA